MPQPLPREPGRAGMNVPDLSMISELLSRDMQSRGIPYSPGQPQAMQADIMSGQPGMLPSIGTSDLLASSRQAREGGNMDVVRALRGVIEGRTSDDAARGPGPKQPNAQGKTSAEPLQISGSDDHGMGVFGALSRALFGVNNAGK